MISPKVMILQFQMDTYLKLTIMVAITSAANIGRDHINEDSDIDSREEGGGDRDWSQVGGKWKGWRKL